METLRFVHAADLHLDSPFQGVRNNAPGGIATALHDATFAAYERIVDLCIQEEAQALLVAGDVYDGADRSLRAQLRFIDGLRRLDEAGIHAFICHGNHDPLDGWTASLELPERSHQFGAEIGAVPFGNGFNATVYGISYPRRDVFDDLTPHFVRQPGDDFAIGLLHTNVGELGEHANYAPCTVEGLAATGIDYWALGHVHTRMELRASNPAIVYPGNIQGRHANESGDRGIYLVDVDSNRRPALTYLSVCSVRWESIEIDISGLESEQDLIDGLYAEADALLDSGNDCAVVCRIRLTGRGNLHTALQRADTVTTLRDELNEGMTRRTPFLWCERISVQTAPAFDRAERLQSEDFLADVLRMIDDLQGSPDDLQALVDSNTAALYTASRAARYLTDTRPGPEDLRRLLTDAETRILNELLERA
jgi:DNA repair protein SbcD/Mre11